MTNNIRAINQNFIDAIKSRVDGSLLDSLIKILPLSKEAIYRRLRGEVMFSYAEAVIISQQLQISLDKINSNSNTNYIAFQILNKKPGIELERAYSEILSFAINKVNSFLISPSYFYLATGGIPAVFTIKHKSISKFRYYKWLYENRELKIQRNKFSQIHVFESLQGIYEKLLNSLMQVNSTFILSDTMIEHFLKSVKYFAVLGLIDQSEIELIKTDLHELINEFETIVASGKYKNGVKVAVYLADISMETSFGYIENETSELSLTQMFAMNYAISENSEVHRIYKEAFEDMKAYATMISQSGSVQSMIFFRNQREIIDSFVT